MTVTIGGLTCLNSLNLSASMIDSRFHSNTSCIAAFAFSLLTFTPNSSAIKVAVSKSILLFRDSIILLAINFLINSPIGTHSFSENSFTVIVSANVISHLRVRVFETL